MGVIRIETPVRCQNWHRATWVAEYSGFDLRHLGVAADEACACPKHEVGQGWFVDGEAIVVSPRCGRCAVVDSISASMKEEFVQKTMQTQEEVDRFMRENPGHRRLKVGDTVTVRIPFEFKVQR